MFIFTLCSLQVLCKLSYSSGGLDGVLHADLPQDRTEGLREPEQPAQQAAKL